MGPRPPVIRRMPPGLPREGSKSSWSQAWRMAVAMDSKWSPTVMWAMARMPMAASCWASQAELVSTVRPEASSSPMDKRMVFMAMRV